MPAAISQRAGSFYGQSPSFPSYVAMMFLTRLRRPPLSRAHNCINNTNTYTWLQRRRYLRRGRKSNANANRKTSAPRTRSPSVRPFVQDRSGSHLFVYTKTTWRVKNLMRYLSLTVYRVWWIRPIERKVCQALLPVQSTRNYRIKNKYPVRLGGQTMCTIGAVHSARYFYLVIHLSQLAGLSTLRPFYRFPFYGRMHMQRILFFQNLIYVCMCLCVCMCNKYVKDNQKQNSYLFETRPKIHRYRKESIGVIMVNSRRKTTHTSKDWNV